MSSFDRRRFLIAFAALSGCGFTPAYGPDGAAEDLRGVIRVDDPANLDEFALVSRLEERLGAPTSPRYALSVALFVREDGLAVTPEQEITRYNVVGQANWAVRPLGEDTIIANGVVDTFTSYDATGTNVATLAAEEDSRKRLMTALADQIVTRLIVTAPEWLA